jgi:hypothetical protein
MTNSTELFNELIRNGKALRLADHPNKAKKHRYARRKVRGFIRLGDWREDDSM